MLGNTRPITSRDLWSSSRNGSHIIFGDKREDKLLDLYGQWTHGVVDI